MNRARMSILVAALALATLPGRADTIFFTDGSSLDGVVRRETRTRVVLEVPGGRLSFPAEDVDRIEENEKTGLPGEKPAASEATPAPAPVLAELTKADERALRAMLADLLNANPAARASARDRIARFGATHDIFPFLERALPYMADRQSVEVLEAAAQLDPVRATPILINAAASGLEKNRARALALLGKGRTHDVAMLQLFARGTLDQSIEVRLAAIAALEQSNDRRATPALVRCLEQADRRLQTASLKALHALWPPGDLFRNMESPEQWRELLELTGEEIRDSIDPATLTPLVEAKAPGDEDYNLGME